MNGKRRIWLIVPMCLWFAVDVLLTLTGQPQEYWTGTYDAAVEANPLAYVVLSQGPWLFVALAVGWALLVLLTVLMCQHPLITWFAIAAAITHAIAGCTWLIRHGAWGWLCAAIYLLIASEVSWWCWRGTTQSR